MVLVDDATNQLRARFGEEETTRASYDAFEGWVRQNGLPGSLYVDRDSIYRCEGRPAWPTNWRAGSRKRSLAEPWRNWEWS